MLNVLKVLNVLNNFYIPIGPIAQVAIAQVAIAQGPIAQGPITQGPIIGPLSNFEIALSALSA